MKLLAHGTVTMTRVAKRHGRDSEEFDKLGDQPTGEEVRLIGPFTVKEVHAQVGTDIKVTISENYHTIALGAHVSIPVDANEEAVKAGLRYCRDIGNLYVNAEMRGARRLLKEMAGK